MFERKTLNFYTFRHLVFRQVKDVHDTIITMWRKNNFLIAFCFCSFFPNYGEIAGVCPTEQYKRIRIYQYASRRKIQEWLPVSAVQKQEQEQEQDHLFFSHMLYSCFLGD